MPSGVTLSILIKFDIIKGPFTKVHLLIKIGKYQFRIIYLPHYTIPYHTILRPNVNLKYQQELGAVNSVSG